MLRLKADPSKLKAKHDNFHITYILHIDSHLPDLGEMILEKKTRIPIQKYKVLYDGEETDTKKSEDWG